VNFREIIDKNMEVIFKYLLKYSRDCFEICLQNFIINPFYLQHPSQQVVTQQNQQVMPGWKNLTEILIKFLLEKLEQTPDHLEPSSPYYEYKDNFQILFFRLIKIPMKLLNKYNDDSFFKPFIKYQILFCVILIGS
jgi:hypothetical protein